MFGLKPVKEGGKPSDLFGGATYDATAEYRAILERADKPLPTDFDRLSDLVSLLGLTMDIAKRDLAAVRRVKTLQPIVDDLESRRQRTNELRDKRKAIKDEWKKVQDEWRKKLAPCDNEVGIAERDLEKSLDARTELNTIKAKYTRAFGGEIDVKEVSTHRYTSRVPL